MIKRLIYEFVQLLVDGIMHFPLEIVRWSCVKIVCKRVGKNVQISRHLHLISPHKISIGDNVFINRSVTLDGRKGLIIEDNVDIGEYCSIWSLQHNPTDANHATTGGMTIVRDHCWIAPHCIILPNVVVGKGSVVATAAVVTKDTPEYAIMAGVPAKKIAKRNNPCEYKLNHKIFF